MVDLLSWHFGRIQSRWSIVPDLVHTCLDLVCWIMNNAIVCHTKSSDHFWKLLFLVQLVPADYCMSDATMDQLWLMMTLMQLTDDCSLVLLTNTETCAITHLQAGPNQPNTWLTYSSVFRNTVVNTGSGKYDGWQIKSDSNLSNGGENTPFDQYWILLITVLCFCV